MDIERELKDSRKFFLENRTGLPDSKVFEEMNKLRLIKKYHLKEKVIGLWIEEIIGLIFTNTLKSKNGKTKIVK